MKLLIPLTLCAASFAATLPDSVLTPGEVLPVTTEQICAHGYSLAARHVTDSMKRSAYREYGFTSTTGMVADHLVPLEIGGANTLLNLWPEVVAGPFGSHKKDRLEKRLQKLVCSGQIDLKSAQTEIAVNWISAYEKYLGK